MNTCGDKSRDVRHVHKEKRADTFGGFADALEIDDARVGASARDNHFWLVFVREFFDFVVVNALVFFAHAVGHEFIHAAGEIQRMTVREVAAVGEIHAEHGVAGL